MKTRTFVLFVLIAVLSMGASFKLNNLESDYPNPSKNQILLTLDDQMRGVAQIGGNREVPLKFDIFSYYSYATSPDCVNCQVYAENQEEGFECNQENLCLENFNEFTNTVDQYFKASGNYAIMNFALKEFSIDIFQVQYIKRLKQLQADKKFHFYSIGLCIDRAFDSMLLYALYEQGKIDTMSYSLTFRDNSYKLILGGFDKTIIKQEFYALKHSQPAFTPYRQSNDFVLANVFVMNNLAFSQISILIDPQVDGIIWPNTFFQSFQDTLRKNRNLPDVSPILINSPGVWSSLKNAPTLKISFVLDDEDAISNFLEVELSPEEYFIKTNKGYYTPNIFFDPNYGNLDNCIRIGKTLLKKVVYYNYSMGDQPALVKEFKLLAPIKNSQYSSS